MHGDTITVLRYPRCKQEQQAIKKDCAATSIATQLLTN